MGIKSISLAASMLVLSASANAQFIDSQNFDSTAIAIDFEDGVLGQTVYTSGSFTVTGGDLYTYGTLGPLEGVQYANAGRGTDPAGAPIQLTFNSNVSAIGFDVRYNNNPVLFQVFDNEDTLLDEYFGSPIQYGAITGYIGLDIGANLISYATISMPALPETTSLVIDNVIYQSSAVPVPAAIWLFGSGLLGLVGVARRKKA